MATEDKVRLIMGKRFESEDLGTVVNNTYPTIAEAIRVFQRVESERPTYHTYHYGVIQALDGREITTLPIASFNITPERIAEWNKIIEGVPTKESVVPDPKLYSLSILVRMRNPRILVEIQRAVSRAAVDPEDATMGVQSVHIDEVKHKKNDCDICGGTCIGADA
ncbi:MAG: hypothetical protein WAX80_00355 [Minisyncoccia bacterium]